MREFFTVLQAVVPVFLVVIGGWLIRRVNWLTGEADASLMRVPVVVRSAAHLLGQCAIPIGLLLIGAIMADHTREFASRQGGRVMLIGSLLRLGLLPLSFLGLAMVLPAVEELRRVLVLQASMPAAVFTIVLARHYGGDAATALRVVVATSVLGLVTIPLWLRYGLHLLGL